MWFAIVIIVSTHQKFKKAYHVLNVQQTLKVLRALFWQQKLLFKIEESENVLE